MKFLLSILCLTLGACAGTPVVINRAVAVKAVSTETIKTSISTARTHTRKAVAVIDQAEKQLREAPLPVRESVRNEPTLAEPKVTTVDLLESAKAEIEAANTQLEKAETGRAVA